MPERIERILAVDDNKVWRHILEATLVKAGLEHEIVATATNAIEKLETGDFTGLITDGLDGGWKRVTHTAHTMGITAVLFSNRTRKISEANEAGILTFKKSQPGPDGKEVLIGVSELQSLIELVAPDTTTTRPS